ncbi:GL24127 [Drosophila persimilis]|uniref:GL24127 n=1 Tax=Drosophila persimilis TaxID=7234 RepID=B4G3S5_DROPE|nr:GL24127 [Drosophila persimilis]
MNTIGIICLLLSLSSIQAETVVQNETHTETETTNYGPITMVVNNLAEIAINVSDETTGPAAVQNGAHSAGYNGQSGRY